jgi:hypothetical protein
MKHHLKGYLSLALENDVIRNAALCATVGIICPIFGQIDPAVDDSSECSSANAEEDACLAILDLASTAAILAFYSYRAVSLLREARFVDMNRAIATGPYEPGGIPLDMIDHISFIPGRIRNEVLQ